METPSKQNATHAPGRRIAVIGLGYAGLPLAVSFGKHQTIVGFDTDQSRIAELKNGRDRNGDISSSELDSSSMNLSSNIDDISACDMFIVVVPTPVDGSKNPDLKNLIEATRMVGSRLKKGDIVV